MHSYATVHIHMHGCAQARTVRGLEDSMAQATKMGEELTKKGNATPTMTKLIEAAADKLEEMRSEIGRCVRERDARLRAFKVADRKCVSEIVSK